ncbi:MAG: anaerobic ribonucleoside-triphosphate reductase activating protein [Candidatus Paceibacterota bacterium]|jgi:pyruvate formate lyase activating enzyme
MLLAGLQKNSLIDFPGKISCIVFTLGCNFRCDFCYNPSLVLHERFSKELLKEEDFFNFLEERKGLLDGVVVTGGEPTLHKDLNLFIKKIKDLGFAVKLDTQGSSPKFLEQILKEGNVDYVAMDIKAPLEKYQKITNSHFDPNLISESIKILKDHKKENKNFDYEFRTTIVAGDLDKTDFEKIGNMIKGSSKYYLQEFHPEDDLNNKEYSKRKGCNKEEMEEFKEIMENYVEKVFVR